MNNAGWQDAEKVAFLTRPTPARRDAPFTRLRSRIAQRLNGPKRTPHFFARCGIVAIDANMEDSNSISCATEFFRSLREKFKVARASKLL